MLSAHLSVRMLCLDRRLPNKEGLIFFLVNIDTEVEIIYKFVLLDYDICNLWWICQSE